MNDKFFSRRSLLKTSAAAACAALAAPLFQTRETRAETKFEIDRAPQKTPVVGSKKATAEDAAAAKVYFSPVIDSATLIKLYNLVNDGIYGKVGIKLHTGERGGPNILPREMVKDLQAAIPNSVIVETNTLYDGDRGDTAKHRQTLEVNGWTFCPVDILDEKGDVNFPVRDGFHLKEVAMGKGLTDYDSLLVLTHFKGHAFGGFGGSMKNIAIGCASGKVGKRQVHGVGAGPIDWSAAARNEMLMELMADSAKAVTDHFGKRITYINVLRNMSVDCDCAGKKAEKPTIHNIGILASSDLLAIDQAACDLVFAQADGEDLRERIESRHGLRQLSAMAEKKMGNPRYKLIIVS